MFFTSLTLVLTNPPFFWVPLPLQPRYLKPLLGIPLKFILFHPSFVWFSRFNFLLPTYGSFAPVSFSWVHCSRVSNNKRCHIRAPCKTQAPPCRTWVLTVRNKKYFTPPHTTETGKMLLVRAILKPCPLLEPSDRGPWLWKRNMPL